MKFRAFSAKLHCVQELTTEVNFHIQSLEKEGYSVSYNPSFVDDGYVVVLVWANPIIAP